MVSGVEPRVGPTGVNSTSAKVIRTMNRSKVTATATARVRDSNRVDEHESIGMCWYCRSCCKIDPSSYDRRFERGENSFSQEERRGEEGFTIDNVATCMSECFPVGFVCIIVRQVALACVPGKGYIRIYGRVV